MVVAKLSILSTTNNKRIQKRLSFTMALIRTIMAVYGRHFKTHTWDHQHHCDRECCQCHVFHFTMGPAK